MISRHKIFTQINYSLYLILFFFFSCNNYNYKLTGNTMGTTYNITIINSTISSQSLKRKVDKLLLDINMIFSTYIKKSEISKLNQSPPYKKIKVSLSLMQLLVMSQKISKETNGMYDITVGPLVNLYGFGPNKKKRKISQEKIQQILKQIGYKKLLIHQKTSTLVKLSKKMYLDFSSIAKGYAVDKTAELFNQLQIKNYFIEIGGETYVRGRNLQNQKWKIGIELPKEYQHKLFKVVSLSNKALATSGNYRNFYFMKNNNKKKKYFHTINTSTGKPAYNSLLSTTVIAKNCTIADAYATAFMSLGLEKSIALVNKINKQQKIQLDVLLIFKTKNNKINSMKIKLLGNMKNYLK